MKFIVSLVKFAWRILNFIRDLVMNIVFLIFVLLALSVFILIVGADKQEKQGALLLQLDGYLADNRDDQSSFKSMLLIQQHKMTT